MIKVALSINNCSNTYLQTAGSTQVQRWYGICKSFCVQEMYEYCKALKKKKSNVKGKTENTPSIILFLMNAVSYV